MSGRGDPFNLRNALLLVRLFEIAAGELDQRRRLASGLSPAFYDGRERAIWSHVDRISRTVIPDSEILISVIIILDVVRPALFIEIKPFCLSGVFVIPDHNWPANSGAGFMTPAPLSIAAALGSTGCCARAGAMAAGYGVVRGRRPLPVLSGELHPASNSAGTIKSNERIQQTPLYVMNRPPPGSS